MAERKSGPVKPPVIDLKAREAEKPAAATTARGKAAEAAEATKGDIAAEAAAQPASAQSPAEEPARQAPPPPRPQARLAMPWSAISISTVAGGLLGAALVYAAGHWLPLPSNVPVISDPTARLELQDATIGDLEARLAAIEGQGKRTQVSLDATIAQLDAGLTELRQAVAAVPSVAPVDLAPVEAQIGSLEDRLTAIGAGASSADATALAGTIGAIETGLADLKTQLAEAKAKSGTLESAVAAITAEMATLKSAVSAQTVAGTDIGPAVRLPLVVSGLEGAVGNGRPYAAELSSLRTLLPDLVVPEAIASSAETGLPRPDVVAAQFSAVVPDILAGRAAVGSGDMGEDALEWMKGLLALRPVGEVAGDSPEAVVSRLEAAVARRDFASAAQLLASLPPAMQAGAGTAGADLVKLAAADAFLTNLRARALAPVAEVAP